MDISDFDSTTDINIFLARVHIDALRENKNPRFILVRAFVGGQLGEQTTPLSRAFIRVANLYESRGYRLVLERFTNDIVRNTYHWSCRQLFDHLLAADIHLLPTHLHQGMLSLGGTETWNTINILTNMQRLKYHLGANCGIFIDDPVANQDKFNYYDPLQKEGLCAPTISVSISHSSGDISKSDHDKIKR